MNRADFAAARPGAAGGFTMVEILVTLAIVGILAALALPQYAWYRTGAFDRDAEHTLRRVATAEEAYFLENDLFIDCDHSDCAALLPEAVYIPEGVLLQITATLSGFTGTATHMKGSGQVFQWN